MLPSPWLVLRQAREALRAGQPDEARNLLAPLAAEGYRKALKLNRDVAKAYLARAGRHLRADNAEAAWGELLAAESLNTGEADAVKLRHTLTRLGLAECRAALEAGHPGHVLGAAVRLQDRRADGPELSVLVEAADDWVLAAEQADRGDFLLAKSMLDRATAKLDPVTATAAGRFAADLHHRHEQFRVAVSELTDAAENGDWPTAAKWADEAVAVAPNHREARSLRARAWDAVRPPAEPALVRLSVVSAGTDLGHPETQSWVAANLAPTHRHGGSSSSSGSAGAAGVPHSQRFLLWIDGVGGFLVCLAPRVTIGQATGDGPIDVPVFADVSRLHAEISRDSEGYVLESGRDVRVNGQPTKRATLACGDRLTLGPTCQFVFRKPVAISPTARLELVSGHRLPQAVDGVLLMAESLILGPPGKSHVALADRDVGTAVIYRSKDGLGVKYDGRFAVDGRPCDGRSPLPLPGVVTGDGFTFAVEPVGPRL
ncbi:MAG: FHA domain-containing protein [Fimbriiglobus sp.]